MESIVVLLLVLNTVISALSLSILAYTKFPTVEIAKQAGTTVFRRKAPGKFKPVVNDEEKQWRQEQKEANEQIPM